MTTETEAQVESVEEKQAQTEKTFTQSQVSAIVAKETRRLQKELESRPTSDQLEELKKQLQELAEQKELSGKSQSEQVEHKYLKQIEKAERTRQELEKLLTEERNKSADSVKKLEGERLNRVLSDALVKSGVHSKSLDDALMILSGSISDPEFDGKAYKLTYGQLIDESPEKIAKAFLEERDWYASAKAGGADTKPSNGVSIPKGGFADMNLSQILQIAESQKPI